MPYDLYERHKVVITLLQGLPVQTVLDIGGRSGLLRRFATYDVTALNVDRSGDVQFGGRAVPYRDDQFDAVVSIDTLEHIPRRGRHEFLMECLRVTKRYLVIAAPFGSSGHVAQETRLNKLYRQVHGRPHIYLDEHVKYGLPTAAELEELVAGLGTVNHRICFAGDYVWQGEHFERVWLDKGQKGPRHRVRRFLDHLYSLACFHPVRIKDRPYESANRFYLMVESEP
jgi:SAM-dependent methyltransferase